MSAPRLARLDIGGQLAVTWRDDTGRQRSEHVDISSPALTSRGVRRRWATYALERAGWWASGRWSVDESGADVRRVTPIERVIGPGPGMR